MSHQFSSTKKRVIEISGTKKPKNDKKIIIKPETIRHSKIYGINNEEYIPISFM